MTTIDWRGLRSRAVALHRDIARIELPGSAKGVYLMQKLLSAAIQLIEAILRLEDWMSEDAARQSRGSQKEIAEAPDPALLVDRARRALTGKTDDE